MVVIILPLAKLTAKNLNEDMKEGAVVDGAMVSKEIVVEGDLPMDGLLHKLAGMS